MIIVGGIFFCTHTLAATHTPISRYFFSRFRFPLPIPPLALGYRRTYSGTTHTHSTQPHVTPQPKTKGQKQLATPTPHCPEGPHCALSSSASLSLSLSLSFLSLSLFLSAAAPCLSVFFFSSVVGFDSFPVLLPAALFPARSRSLLSYLARHTKKPTTTPP
jgi:hypothetical protein